MAKRAASQAVKRLREKIERGVYKPGEKLPPVTRLATALRTSPVTAWKALNALREEGLVEGVPGHPFTVVDARGSGTDDSASVSAIPATKHEAIAARIQKDILNGIYRAGKPLPSRKVLEKRYNVSYPTIRKAIETLCAKSLIYPCTGGYAVSDISSPTGSGRIVLLGQNFLWAGMRMWGDLNEEFLRNLKMRCSQANVDLDPIVFDTRETDLRFFRQGYDRSIQLKDTRGVLGYIVLLRDIDYRDDPLLRFCSRINKPVAIIDERGDLRLPDFYSRPGNVCMFPVGALSACGSNVARYLLACGHQRVVYISPYHATKWSALRLQGLEQTFKAAGFKNGVSCLALEQFDRREFHESASRQPHIRSLLSSLDKATRKNASAFGMRIRSLLEEMIPAQISSDEIFRRLGPLFDKALKDKQVTAIIGATDETAVFALEYLRKKGIDVPRKISAIGFDDTAIALRSNITSYNFNIPAIVDGVIRHLLSPLRRSPSSRPRVCEIDGMIVERGTVGKAPIEPA